MQRSEIIMLRHGESVWNLENRFTGWVDVPLSEKGLQEALQAGKRLRSLGKQFDVVHTSVLKRAVQTAWHILDQSDQLWIPWHKSYRLNERHYGALQGLNKAETVLRHGEEQVQIWRRSYSIAPPDISIEELKQETVAGYQCFDRRYQALTTLPRGESLEKTVQRVKPYWEDVLYPALRSGQRILLVAHGNSLRGLIKLVEGQSDEAIVDLNIPTGTPIVWRFHPETGRFIERLEIK